MDEEGTRPMIVDAMGVFEYTGSRLTVDSSEFLAALYDILAPGGRLLIGQMRSDRPNPDFTLGVVAWPYIELRNPNEFMAVVRDAGIPPDRAELFLPTDGVNSILAIDKPRAHEINLAASSYVLQLPHALFDNMI